MISGGVEISIAGGGGAMVCVCLSLGRNQAPYIGIFHHPNPGDSSPRTT